MSGPRVTVCMPSYNCASFLPAAIESVLGQSFADFELLIADDCSSDGSREIAARYAALDRRVVLRLRERNLGMVQNWNACLGEARGEYLKYLFSDDLLASKDALQEMVALLDADRDISLVASARNIIGDHQGEASIASAFPADKVLPGTEVINRCLLAQRNLVGEPSAVMFRKSQAGRGFDSSYSQFVDLEMWFHLLEQGRFGYLKEPLACFRMHADQQTKKNVRNLVHVEEMLLLLGAYGAKAYVTLGRRTREFLLYHQLYRIWKAHKTKLVGREAALAKITAHMPARQFLMLIPLYKLLNPLWKLVCRLRLPVATKMAP